MNDSHCEEQLQKNEMRTQLVLMLFSLWGAPSSREDEYEQLQPYITRINCGDKKKIELFCDDNCTIAYGDGWYSEYDDVSDITCECEQCNSEPEATSEANSSNKPTTKCEQSNSEPEATSEANSSNKPTTKCEQCNSEPEATSEANSSNNSTTVVVLGTLVGLLLVLLTVVTTMLVWTCWLLKIRGGLNSSAERQARSGTDHGQLANPTYEGDDLLRLQPSGSVPAYETIPPHPRDEARLEFIEQGENGYSVLSREQRANPETTTPSHMETILEDSREESYSKLELKKETVSAKKTSDEEYSRLERVNIGSTVPTDTHLDNDTTADSKCDNSEQTERKERVMDDKAFDDTDGDALQLESGDMEEGQQEEAKGKPPLITITLDVQNERNDSNNTNSTDSA